MKKIFVIAFIVMGFSLYSTTPITVNCNFENSWQNGTEIHGIWCVIEDLSGQLIKNAVVTVNGQRLLLTYQSGKAGYWYEAPGFFNRSIRIRV